MDDARGRWDARWAARGDRPSEPTRWLDLVEPWLEGVRTALDVAGGEGRNALPLARRGIEVTVADVSPMALERARQFAGDLPVRTLEVDLEREDPPAGRWDLVMQHHFLFRPLLWRLPSLLAPGGLLLVVQPTRRNLERHPHPSARFLLEEGELGAWAHGLEVLHQEEGWTEEGRHEAVLLARAPY